MKSLLHLYVACLIGTTTIHAQTVMDGPDAPLMGFSYSAGAYTLTLSNPPTSNNYNQQYAEVDLNVPDPTDPAQAWMFQGYIIHQVLHDSVTLEQLDDPALARVVVQTDIQDSIGDLYNAFFDGPSGSCVLSLMVSASNTGLQMMHTLTTDPFTNQPYQDSVTYCFVARAYASNLYRTATFCPNEPFNFIASTRNPSGAMPRYCVNSSTVGVSDMMEDDPLIRIYPNPTHDVITIDGPGRYQIRVMDGLGRFLDEQAGSSKMVMDLSRYTPGKYLLEVVDGSGRRRIEQVMRH